jgi:hypothetical protein
MVIVRLLPMGQSNYYQDKNKSNTISLFLIYP